MNIIFLDIDGVLNNWTNDASTSPISDDCSHIFNDIMKELNNYENTQIVISSTWRKRNTKNQFIQIIQNETPYHQWTKYLHEDWKTPIIGMFNNFRGKEVNSWLSKHSDINKYLCIDDDSDFFPDQPLLNTNNLTGLTCIDIDIIKYFFLKGKNEYIIDNINLQIKYFQKKLKFFNNCIS